MVWDLQDLRKHIKKHMKSSFDPSGWEILADREYLSKDPENKLLKQP